MLPTILDDNEYKTRQASVAGLCGVCDFKSRDLLPFEIVRAARLQNETEKKKKNF